MKKILQDLSLAELTQEIISLGERKFRAAQAFSGLLSGKTVEELPAVPKALKEKLLQTYENAPLAVEKTFYSSDGTEKYLFRLADGNLIEGVLMKYKYGYTQCVSTQAGCRMGCKFCASTLNGLIRNLTPGEILSQILLVNALHKNDADLAGEGKEKRAVTNVVLMGSGEPLDNYDNVIKFLRLLTAKEGLNVSARNISLSTCGLVPKMYRLADEGIPLNLTVSLHATEDSERQKIMPVARAYKIADILKACANYFNKTGRRYYFEYTLIDGENCDEAHAEALSALLKGKPCHVNLIRLNEVKERSLKATGDKNAYRFMGVLQKNGISATLRRQIGADIGGACGQLRAAYVKEKNEREIAAKDVRD
ncbi:MAG: 23S rRNA (adenine(2503)-C(2))-methyltransferase RlmN [Candidatus Borkfalkiaceae bacterium]|nr:23S rRNA (adenine(2503)-C(2))-methyltransferase RlmN [Clostridia bacterium]MDY6223299.1 23S rRNA (adenine(2503)-C(2))-methyltransferase RlmN [Christensenellaceae bacterium]